METDSMTCIVGLIEKDKVIIGGDSAASSDCNLFVRKDPKVFLTESEKLKIEENIVRRVRTKGCIIL